MTSTFLIADPKFNDEAAAAEQNMDIATYNTTLINHINAVCSYEDTLLFMGDLGKDPGQYIGSLKPEIKKLIDLRFQPIYNTRELAQQLHFTSAFTIDGFEKNTMYDTMYFVIVTSDEDYHKKHYSTQTEDGQLKFYAMPASRHNFIKDRLENNYLNISTNAWELNPIKYSELPRMIDNERLFNSMIEEEHTSDIV